MKAAPPPAAAPTTMAPPCSMTMRRLMARPSPVPRLPLVVKYGVKSFSRTSGGMPGPESSTNKLFWSHFLQEMTEAMNRGWEGRDSRTVLLLQEERAGVDMRVPQDRVNQILEDDGKSS